MSLQVCEIFHSLQGESTFTGLPCTFVRLSGCNLACRWCDTTYAATESEDMDVDTVLERVAPYGSSLVEITGGEPLLQPDAPLLIRRLLDREYQVLLETNGSRSILGVDPRCVRILDIKCPSSGEGNSFLWDNLNHLTLTDEVKFVIGTRDDYLFARQTIRKFLSRTDKSRIHLSPVFGDITPKTLAEWILEDGLGARLSLQQHKMIWDPDLRGV